MARCYALLLSKYYAGYGPVPCVKPKRSDHNSQFVILYSSCIHNHVVSFKKVMDRLKVYLLGHSAKRVSVLKYAMMIISCIMLSAYAAIGWGFAHEVKIILPDGIRVDSGNYTDFVIEFPSQLSAVRAAFWSAPVKAFETKLKKADAYLVYQVGILQGGHMMANFRVDATSSRALKQKALEDQKLTTPKRTANDEKINN